MELIRHANYWYDCTLTIELASLQYCTQPGIRYASSPVSIQTQSLALRALRKRKPQETQALALVSRNKRKRQPIGMLGRRSGNHDWLLANASDCV